MKCLCCNNDFYIRRNLYSLFNTKIYYLCDRCLKDNPVDLMIDYIMLDANEAYVLSLLRKKINFSYDAYIHEMSYVISKYLLDDRYFVIFVEELYVSQIIVEILDFLSNVLKKKVLIITYVKLN